MKFNLQETREITDCFGEISVFMELFDELEQNAFNMRKDTLKYTVYLDNYFNDKKLNNGQKYLLLKKLANHKGNWNHDTVKELLSECESKKCRHNQTQRTKSLPAHFARSFNTAEQKKLFDGLANGGYLTEETNYRHFCFVFGGTVIPDNEKPFERLQWTGTLKELHYFVTKHFPKQRNQWETTVKCFLFENNPVNKNSLATAIDKYDKLPETSTTIDNLL